MPAALTFAAGGCGAAADMALSVNSYILGIFLVFASGFIGVMAFLALVDVVSGE